MHAHVCVLYKWLVVMYQNNTNICITLLWWYQVYW